MNDRQTQKRTAAGPLVVSEANPRYFTAAGDGRAGHLTGSHIWNNLPRRHGSGGQVRRPGTSTSA
jgi:hypothetical protein